MIAYDPRITIQRDRRARFGWDLPPEFYAWENRDNFAECGPTSPCGAATSGKPARVRARRPFRFPSAVPVEYRPFEKKWLYYTGKSRGLMGSPRYDVMKHLSAVVVALLHAEPPENRAGDGRRYARSESKRRRRICNSCHST